MGDNIKQLFGLSANGAEVQNNGPSVKQAQETYRQWGHRMAGINQGNNTSLMPHLQIVYQTLRQEQQNDQALQDQLKQEKQQQIIQAETTLAQEQNNLQKARNTIEDIKQKINAIEAALDKLKGDVKRINQQAKADFIIGLIILLPLTIYLFLFYSSTAYSAFFKEIDYTQALGSHMFDPQALSISWEQSWTAGLFVLLIPFIFLALGFVLHRFTEQQGAPKYIKSGSIILVTFIFDTLLAFLIAKNMYDAEALTQLGDIPPYALSMAFVDAHFWVVIFCGFLAYIIWGLLFGFTMDSYNKLDLNKVEQKRLEKQKNQLQDQLKEEQQKENTIENRIHSIEGNIAALKEQLSTGIRIDLTKIELELNHFFSGWTSYLNGAAKPAKEQAEANNIFQSFVNQIKTAKQN